MNPIISQLNRTIEAKTQAAVDKLHGLRVEVQAALEAAEAEARERMAAEVQALNIDVDVMLQEFGERLTEMSRDYFASAVGQMVEKVERLNCGCCDSEAEEPRIVMTPALEAQAVERRDAIPFSAMDAGGKELPEVPDEDAAAVEWAEVPGAVAAQETERQDFGVITGGPERADNPSNPRPDELFEKRGKGRKTTYVPVDLPEDGRTYFRRAGNDWEPVVWGEG